MKKKFLSLVCFALALSACEGEKSKDVAPNASNAPAVAPAAPQAATPAAASVAEKKKGEYAKAEIRTIDWAKAEELAQAGGLYVDVRYPEELSQGYVMNSVNIPLDEIKHRLNELPKDRDLLVYCRSGRRSEAATNLLQKNGFERVYNVAGGFLAYPKK